MENKKLPPKRPPQNGRPPQRPPISQKTVARPQNGKPTQRNEYARFQRKEKQGNTAIIALAVVFGIAFFTLLGVFIATNILKDKDGDGINDKDILPEYYPPSSSLAYEDLNGAVVNDENEEAIASMMAEASNFTTDMTMQWSFANGKKGTGGNKDVVFGNYIENPYPCYFVLLLGDLEISRGPLLQPGEEISGAQIKLKENLEQDTYKPICEVHIVFPDGREDTRQFQMDMTIQN